MLLTIIYYVAGATQRNDGRQRNVRRRSVCDCCRRNRLQRRRFSLVTNIVAVTRMRTGCESSRKFLETQVISSSLDGWTVARRRRARRPARWRGWTSALITLSVICCSPSLLLLLPRSPSPHAVCMFVCAAVAAAARCTPVNVCMGCHRTAACYTHKLTFSHSSSIKVWGAYYTNMRIIFEFLR